MALIIVGAVLLITAGIVLTSGGSEKALSENPRANTLYEEGTADVEAFRPQPAIAKLDEALRLDPQLAEAAISRAFAKGQLGRIPEYLLDIALADSLVAVIEDGDRRLIAELRLSGRRASRYFSLADSLMTTAQRRAPENIYVMVTHANRLKETGTVDEVEQAFLDILAVNPNYANAYNELGYVKLWRGDFKQAVEHLQKYAFLAPNDANPHDSLGEVYLVIGEYEKAEQEFREALSIQPDLYPSLENLAKIYLARGQIDMGMEIVENLRTQVTGTGFEQKMDRYLIDAFRFNGMVDELGEATVSFISKYPDADVTAFYRSMVLAYRDRDDEALALADSTFGAWYRMHELHNADASPIYIKIAEATFRGLMADLRENPQQRVSRWREVVDMQAQTRLADYEKRIERFLLASALNDAGETTEALEILHDILMVNSRLAAPLALTTTCYLDLEDAKSASKALKKLQWSISKADDDFPARRWADTLEARLAELTAGAM